MRGMVEDALQQRDDPPVPVHPLESDIRNIVTDALNIVDNVLDDVSDDGEDDEPMGVNASRNAEESAVRA